MSNELSNAEIERQKAEANRNHVGTVRKAAKEALMNLGLSEDQAKMVVLAINSNKIPAVKINY